MKLDKQQVLKILKIIGVFLVAIGSSGGVVTLLTNPEVAEVITGLLE